MQAYRNAWGSGFNIQFRTSFSMSLPEGVMEATSAEMPLAIGAQTILSAWHGHPSRPVSITLNSLTGVVARVYTTVGSTAPLHRGTLSAGQTLNLGGDFTGIRIVLTTTIANRSATITMRCLIINSGALGEEISESDDIRAMDSTFVLISDPSQYCDEQYKIVRMWVVCHYSLEALSEPVYVKWRYTAFCTTGLA